MLIKRKILPHMAPVVSGGITVVNAGSSTGTINGGNTALTFGTGNYRNGDMILAAWGANGATLVPTFSGAGFYRLVKAGSVTAVLEVWCKFFDRDFIVTASDTVPLAFLVGTGAATDATNFGWQVWRGIDEMHPLDVDPVTTNGGGTTPDAASITTATANALVVAVAANAVSDTTPGSVTNYSNQISSNANDTQPCSFALTSRLIATAGAENPGAWSAWSAGNWNAATLAFRPARF